MNIPCVNPCQSCSTPAPGTRGAPNPNDPQNPLVNLSSEAPDKDNFIGRRWGILPDGDYWPPLGRNWYAIGCVGFCVSDESQAEADLCAANQALICTATNWPPVIVVDPNVDPPVVVPQPTITYSNDEQTGYFTCPDGSQTRYEVAAGSFSALSKAAADAMAYAYAVEQAALSYICFTDLTANRCCAGSSFSATVTVNTPLSVTLSIVGSLPPGLIATVDGKTMTISGTPVAAGQYNFRVNARESAQNSAEKFVTINVNDISNDSNLPAATAGVAYSTTLVMGGPDTGSEVTWAISGGALPTGLTLGATTGTISGIPTSAGTSIFYVRMTSGTLQCVKVFSVTVSDSTGCFTNDSALPDGSQLTPYSVNLFPAFSPDPGFEFVYTVTSGALPSGLTLDSATGVISGNPVSTGNYNFCVTLTQQLIPPGP